MAVKDLDERHFTRSGQIRIERWVEGDGTLVSYNMAYINPGIHAGDYGRVFGFDDAHRYPGFPSKHHMHWFGRTVPVMGFASFSETLLHHYGKGY